MEGDSNNEKALDSFLMKDHDEVEVVQTSYLSFIKSKYAVKAIQSMNEYVEQAMVKEWQENLDACNLSEQISNVNEDFGPHSDYDKDEIPIHGCTFSGGDFSGRNLQIDNFCCDESDETEDNFWSGLSTLKSPSKSPDIHIKQGTTIASPDAYVPSFYKSPESDGSGTFNNHSSSHSFLDNIDNNKVNIEEVNEKIQLLSHFENDSSDDDDDECRKREYQPHQLGIDLERMLGVSRNAAYQFMLEEAGRQSVKTDADAFLAAYIQQVSALSLDDINDNDDIETLEDTSEIDDTVPLSITNVNEHSDDINEDINYLMGFDIRHNTHAHTPEQNSLYLDCNNDNNNEDYNLDTDNNNTTSESNCHILNNYECDDDSDDDVTFNDDIVLNL